MVKNAEKTAASGSLARERLEGRMVGGRFSNLANYSELFDRSRDAIFLVDIRNFEVLETNPAVSELLGSTDPWVGSPFTSFFGAEAEVQLTEWLKACVIGSENSVTTEVRSFQSRCIEFSCAKVQLADYCEVLQVLGHDVTEERQKAAHLETQSLTDEMTGLSNFRSFSSRHLLEHERSEKKNQPYSILFFDVDHFKHFNDRNGHPAGDEALRKVASTLRECATRTEFVARYGGEEFVVLCANADSATGFAFADRARQAIESTSFTHGEAQPLGRVTVSVGVSTFYGKASTAEILKQADAALYESKKGGRNRVSAFEESPTSIRPVKRAIS